jgi:PknH-like extracellular domain
MKRELLTLGCAGLAILLPVVPSATADTSAAQVTGSNIDSVLLTGATVGDILGTNMPVQQRAKRPMPATKLDKNPECATLFGPDTKFYGSNLNLYRISLLEDDNDQPDYVVIQSVATFPDSQTAKSVLSNGMQPTANCNQTVQITDLDSKPTWQLSAPQVSAGDAKWHMAQLYQGDPVGWNCYFNLHAAENAILQAQICQMGNAGPAVSQMMGQMVGGLPS